MKPRLTTISQGEYLQLVGLLTLAGRHERHVADIRTAVLELLGVTVGTNDEDHVSDAIFEGYAAEKLLDRLGIPLLFNDGLAAVDALPPSASPVA